MTTNSVPPVVQDLEDGLTRTHAIPFLFDTNDALKVQRVVDGVSIILRLGIDYQVGGAGNPRGGSIQKMDGGIAGAVLRIDRVTPRIQSMSYTANDTFPAKSHEKALDRAMLIDQEQDAKLDDTAARALLVPVGETVPGLPSRDRRNGRALIGMPDGSFGAAFLGPDLDPSLRTDLADGLLGVGIIGYIAGYFGAKIRSLKSKLMSSVDVMDFGAVGDGVTDDTAAFNAAIATRRMVRVPYTPAGYSIADVGVLDGMQVSGDKHGMSDASMLLVNTNNAAAFYNQSDDNVFNVTLENLVVAAKPGVLGASLYKSKTATKYSAYFTLRNIETHLSLKISYKGLFIFTVWDRVRDGYYGSRVNDSHCFIQALAESYGQTNRQNINKINDSMVFNSYGTQAAIIASYGTKWAIAFTDFEALSTAAFRGYNMTNVHFYDTWFEGINAEALVALSNYEGTGAGCSAMFEKGQFVFTNQNATYAVTIEDGTIGFRDCEFNLTGPNMRLTNNPARVTVNDNCVVDGGAALTFMDGAHADTYANGRKMLNGGRYNGVAPMTIINKGGIAASEGFMSNANIAVGLSYVALATSAHRLGGTCIVSGFDPVGGLMFRVIKNWQGAAIVDVVAPINPTGKIFDFRINGDTLEMKVDVGALVAFTTMLN